MGINKTKTALIFGLCIGGWHTLWSALVALKWAEPLLGWVLWLHFLSNPYEIAAFSFSKAAALIMLTFFTGAAGGWVFAFLWNLLHGGE